MFLLFFGLASLVTSVVADVLIIEVNLFQFIQFSDTCLHFSLNHFDNVQVLDPSTKRKSNISTLIYHLICTLHCTQVFSVEYANSALKLTDFLIWHNVICNITIFNNKTSSLINRFTNDSLLSFQLNRRRMLFNYFNTI